MELSDPRLESLWRRAEELGALIFIHPWGCSLGERLDQFFLYNVVGQPVETTVALSHLVFSGVFDRYPTLRVLAAHGGGYFPYYPGRGDHARRVRPELTKPARAPSTYAEHLYFDSLVHSPEVLATLIAHVGARRVLMGSDFPFDMGTSDPVASIDALANLSKADRRAILGATALSLLGLE
jgi:aminocarboxymuconate-semialdehyde decarboxylase